MAELPRHSVTRNTLTATLTAPLIRGHHTTGNHGTICSKELPSRFQAKPVKAAESSQVRALEGSVEHEGLAVENEILDNLILYQGPHLRPNEFPAPETTHGNLDYTLHSEEPH
ncbi:hypothetical protein ABIB48_000625 [Arthrobacter sp. UYCu511]